VNVLSQPLPGVFLIGSDSFQDERGIFTNAWLTTALAGHGIDTRVAQMMLSFSYRKGTLRGMHLQVSPHEQHKTVRVTRGAIFDVAVDMRPESPTYLQWTGHELSADNRRVLHVPAGYAHGFQTLADDTEVLYVVSGDYSPAHERGYRYNDPAFGIEWPLGEPSVINARDASFPDVAR
jgi:dTDP-4-dehydrorhamnose 3,5-epimerase